MAKVDDMQNSISRLHDDLQGSIATKILCSSEQTQCAVGGLQMQVMNMQAQVQALLIGQSQLQAQMMARQAADGQSLHQTQMLGRHAADVSPVESRKQTK